MSLISQMQYNCEDFVDSLEGNYSIVNENIEQQNENIITPLTGLRFFFNKIDGNI